MVRFASQEEISHWNNHIIANPDGGNIFQTKEFSVLKAASHWTPRYLLVENVYILILERYIPLLGKFWYAPKGPGITTAQELKRILQTLKQFAKKQHVFMIKCEPDLIKTDEMIHEMTDYGFIMSGGIQVTNTITLDISPSVEDIVSRFSSKTRYNIRAAQKAGITTAVVPINDTNSDIFYDMLYNLVNGKAALRSREYVKKFWQLHDEAGTGVFMFAELDGRVVATDFLILLGTKGNRKDAASIRDSSIRGASALLEVEAIRYMKEKGITFYDLCGSPPSDRIKDPTHPYYGFGVFKAGFNSHVTDFVGSCDFVVKPLPYKIWSLIGDRIARRFYRTFYRDTFY